MCTSCGGAQRQYKPTQQRVRALSARPYKTGETSLDLEKKEAQKPTLGFFFAKAEAQKKEEAAAARPHGLTEEASP